MESSDSDVLRFLEEMTQDKDFMAISDNMAKWDRCDIVDMPDGRQYCKNCKQYVGGDSE